MASSGFPEVVYFPETTQEFEPMPLPFGPRRAGMPSRTSERAPSWDCVPEPDEPVPSRPPPGVSPVVAPSASPASAFGSNFPVDSSTAPRSTIGWWSAYGYSGYSCLIWLALIRLVMSERSISSCMLPRRSQAIALSQATESTGVHGSIA